MDESLNQRSKTDEMPHVTVTTSAEAPAASGFWSRVRFVHKIMLLITILICLTGVSVTAITVVHFRHSMYQQEYSAAFTVYAAAANYLSGHYKSNDSQYVPKSIDYVLRHKFLRLPGLQRHLITHHPSRLVLYDQWGRVIFDYRTDQSVPAAQDLPRGLLPLAYGPKHFPDEKVIRIAGPVSPAGDIPGYVEMSFPTEIQEKVRDLFRRSFMLMLGVLIVALGLSWIFARHTLAPIGILTAAAHRVRLGDMNQHVPVTSNDEIGELAATFNEMVASISRRITLLHRIQEWTVKIGRELETERLYGTLVAMFSLMSTSHACRLYIYDEGSDSLVSRVDRGGDHLPAAAEDKLAQAAFDERWSQFIKEGGQMTDDPFDAVEAAIPLLSGEHRIGVIRIGKNHEGKAYDDETLTILQTLAQHASVAADNAHLYEQLAEKERIEQEMKWARRIQQSMLPRETPSLPGYQIYGESVPALEVGGDYFDYVTTDGLRWYFAIADVSGKGVPAALIMSIVRSLLHTYVDFEASPREVLLKVNSKLTQDLEPEMFVTIAILCLDPMEHKLYVARGGHEPALLRRESGEVIRIEPHGAALGLLDVETFEEALEPYECHLGPNDVVLLYTDGVTEAHNGKGEEYGLERLEALLAESGGAAAQEIFHRVTDAVRDFATGQMQHDDLTLVVLRRLG